MPLKRIQAANANIGADFSVVPQFNAFMQSSIGDNKMLVPEGKYSSMMNFKHNRHCYKSAIKECKTLKSLINKTS